MTSKTQWINWEGGPSPCYFDNKTIVQVMFRDGRIKTAPARQFHWWHDGRDATNDIMKWRVMTRIAREDLPPVVRVKQDKPAFKFDPVH